MCRRLLDLGVELVAIERPDGLLIERLLDAGLRAIAIHPTSGGPGVSEPAAVLSETSRDWPSMPTSDLVVSSKPPT